MLVQCNRPSIHRTSIPVALSLADDWPKLESERYIDMTADLDPADVSPDSITDELSDFDEFERQLNAETQEYRTERGEEMGIQRLGTISATIAEHTDTETIVSAHNDGIAQLREVGSDRRLLDDEVLAVGSGAQTALGQLEGANVDIDLDTADSLARDVLTTVAEHDTATGPDIDVWRLEDTN